MIVVLIPLFCFGSFFDLGTCAKYQLVDKCPLSSDTWSNRSSHFTCNIDQGLFYHCFRTQNDSMIEICQSLQFFSNTELQAGQCPFINVTSEKFPFGYETCQNHINSRCPNANESFSSSQLFLYDGCLLPRENSNTAVNFTTTTTQHGSSTSFWTEYVTNNATNTEEKQTKESKDENCMKEQAAHKNLKCYTTTYVVAGVMSVLVCLAVAATSYLYKRTKHYQRKLEIMTYVSMTTANNEDDQTIKPHNYGRIYNEITENSSPGGSVSSGYETPKNGVRRTPRPTQGQIETGASAEVNSQEDAINIAD